MFLSCKLSCNYILKKMMRAKYLPLLVMIFFPIYSCREFSLKVTYGGYAPDVNLENILVLAMEIYRCSSTRGIERCMPGSDDNVPACEKHL